MRDVRVEVRCRPREEAALRRVAPLAALAAFAALATVARRASTEPASQVRLVWVLGERTDGCDDRATIARRVDERLGRDVFSELASRSIEGVIQHEGERREAHLYVREADGRLFGSRHLTSTAADCAALDAAVTLAIALVIDPDAALRPAPAGPAAAVAPPASPPPSPEAPSPAPTQPPTFASSPPRPPAKPPPAPRLALPPSPKPPEPARTGSLAVTARALVAAGILPGGAFGAALSAQGPTELPFQGSAGILYFPEVRVPAGDFGFGLTAGWLGACARPWATGGVSLAICGTLLLGAIHAVVYALEPLQPGDQVWTGASLSLGMRFRLVGPLVAELGAEGLVPFPAWQFLIKGPNTAAFQEASVAGFGFAGLGVSIP